MKLRSFATLAVALFGLTACTSEPAGSVQANLATGDVQVLVDSVSGAFDPTIITWAHFKVTNGSTTRIRVGSCIEGTAAGIQRPATGDSWETIGVTMCWGSDPALGAVLEPGASLTGNVQVQSAGRYRVVVPYVDDRERTVELHATSSPFDAR